MKKLVKVAYLDYSHVFSGAERSLFSLIQNLNRDHFFPILIFPFPHEHQHQYQGLNVEFHYLSSSKKWWMGSDRWKKPVRGTDFLKRNIFGFLLMVVLVRKSITILHVNLAKHDLFWWIFWSKLFGKKVVAHVRSNYPDWMLSRFLQRYCDAIICVSDHVKDMVELKYLHKKIFSIYDPIEINKQISSNDLKSKKIELNLNPNFRQIASIGLLSPHKGHDTAIEVFSILLNKISNIELIIAGGGTEEELFRLKELCIKYEIQNFVKFTEVQVANINYYYEVVDCVLSLTKIGEAFGRVPFESAVYLTPCVAPNLGAVTELIISRKNGFLVDPFDIFKIVCEIEFILKNDIEVQEIMNNLFNTIESKLDPLIQSKKVMEVYSEIL